MIGRLKNHLHRILLGIFPVSAAIHWIVPFALGVVMIFTILIFLIPQIAVVISLFGTPLINAFIFAKKIRLAWFILLIVLGLSFLGIALRRKVRFFRIDMFQIGIFVFIAWTLISLLWSSNPAWGFHKIQRWIITAILPMEFFIILYMSGWKIKNIPTIAIYVGVLLLALSFFRLHSTGLNPLQRFSVFSEGAEWDYARSVGFLLLTSVWLFDKTDGIKKIFLLAISLVSIYFLVIAATRAPFAVAMFILGIYLIFLSQTKIYTKIIIGGMTLAATAYFISGSYMFLRWVGLEKSMEVSASVRIAIWECALRNLPNIPFIGIGFGSFPKFLPQMLKMILHPHNSFLEMFIELGVPGVILYTSLMLILPLRAIYVYIRHRFENEYSESSATLEYAILVWSYGFANSLINDALGSGRYEWIALGLMYPALIEIGCKKYEQVSNGARQT